MTNLLANLGVKPQAIEQPLELTIPENKLVLAIYLAQSELESERPLLDVQIKLLKKERNIFVLKRLTPELCDGFLSSWQRVNGILTRFGAKQGQKDCPAVEKFLAGHQKSGILW